MNLSTLAEQNIWWQSPEQISLDPTLMALKEFQYLWKPNILETFDFTQDFIYVLKGPRQVGKTTLLKTLVKRLLKNNVPHRNIFYFSCNLVESYAGLEETINLYLNWIRSKNENRVFLFIDEISLVKNWQRVIKHFVDLGKVKNATLILTGSHAVDIKKSSERLPGRRGKSIDLDKLLLPMTFAEYLKTVDPKLFNKVNLNNILNFDMAQFMDVAIFQQEIEVHFQNYLLTGGFPLSVNALNTEKSIPPWIYNTYLQWVIGDLTKLGKHEIYFKQIARKVIESYATPVSWQTICKTTDIGSHNTVYDYVEHLEYSFILSMFYCLDVNKKLAAFRKNKKLYFADPFIFHTLNSWLKDSNAPFMISEQYCFDTVSLSKLIENVVGIHLSRIIPNVFYWHNRKEIDFVFYSDDQIFPVEVKYQEEINLRELAYLKSFNRAIIVTKSELKQVDNLLLVPASLFCLGGGIK